MNQNFDQSILDNEEEFKKSFKKIDHKDRPNATINNSLHQTKDTSQLDKHIDEVIERLLQDKNALRKLKAALEKI